MRVLTVLPDVPFPAVSGLHHRMLGNLKLVKKLGHESHVLMFSTEDSDRLRHLDRRDLIPEFADVLYHGGTRVPQTKFSMVRRLSSKARFLALGTIRRPDTIYPFSMRYDAIGGAQIVADYVRRAEIDVVVLPSIMSHWSNALIARDSQVVVDAADVLTDLTRDLLSAYGGGNPLRRLSLRANAVASASQEQIFLAACDEVWVTSPGEARRINSIAPLVRAVVVPNIIPDPGRFVRPTNGSSIGFLATYSYRPNLDAATILVEEIFPAVRENVPAAVLRIAGADLPEHVRLNWSRLPGVEILGRVASSRQFLLGLSLVAMPISVRGGVPLKLVECLSLELPIVAYPELARSLPLRSGVELELVRNNGEFARRICELLEDSERRIRLGIAGRRAYERLFSEDALGRAGTMSGVLNPSSPPRGDSDPGVGA